MTTHHQGGVSWKRPRLSVTAGAGAEGSVHPAARLVICGDSVMASMWVAPHETSGPNLGSPPQAGQVRSGHRRRHVITWKAMCSCSARPNLAPSVKSSPQ
jgi:hypothetical protein